MRQLPAVVVQAVELKLDLVEEELRATSLEEVLAEEDWLWSWSVPGGWHVVVEVNNDTRQVTPAGATLDLEVAVGRWLARPRMRRRVHLPGR